MVFGRRISLPLLLAAMAMLLPVLATPGRAGAVTATYLFDLSTFTGTVPFDWARGCADSVNKEVYVAFGDTIRIFNNTGMEIYRLGTYDIGAGMITGMTIDAAGDLLLLSYKASYDYSVIVSDFRGRRKVEFTIQGLPPAFKDFYPNSIFYRDGKLYLASLPELKIVVTDPSGKFLDGYDVAPLIGVKDEDRRENDMFAFSVTAQGEMIFTIPSAGKAYVLNPDRTIKEFGKRGSGPGKFGVPAGIAADQQGNIYVSDTLRSVVLIFGKDLGFITEFGGRGLAPGKFIAPRDIFVDGDNRVYVTQLRKRGISVYKIQEE